MIIVPFEPNKFQFDSDDVQSAHIRIAPMTSQMLTAKCIIVTAHLWNRGISSESFKKFQRHDMQLRPHFSPNHKSHNSLEIRGNLCIQSPYRRKDRLDFQS